MVDYTKGKKIKELKSAVEKARSEELAKKAILTLEDVEGVELGARRSPVAQIVAPSDGTLVYAVPNRSRAVQKRECTLYLPADTSRKGRPSASGKLLFEIVPTPETKAGTG